MVAEEEEEEEEAVAVPIKSTLIKQQELQNIACDEQLGVLCRKVRIFSAWVFSPLVSLSVKILNF